MPITNTLKTADEFRRTGFTQEQSNLLAQKFEETASAITQDLKDFIRAEIAAMELRFEARMAAGFAELRLEIEKVRGEVGAVRAELHSALRDQMVKFVAILVGIVSVAVAIIKFLPNFSSM